MKKIIILGIVILLIALGIFVFTRSDSENMDTEVNTDTNTATTTEQTTEPAANMEVDKTKTEIGTSVKGNTITAYHYGEGEKEVLLVGGIHGGYSNNTVTLSYELMDYFQNNENEIPENVKLTIIPVLNPDGLNETVGSTGRFEVSDIPSSEAKKVAGRFNANGVDLNRNFACDWQAEAKWQSKTVSGGKGEFSEPESQALKSYIEKSNPSAVIVWYSSAGGVFASNCHNGVLPETQELTKTFANASGYPLYQEFNFYEITGDAVNWMAKENIPAISVLLTNHTDTEETKNINGVKAVLNLLAK